MKSVKTVGKMVFIVIGSLASLITIFGFIIDQIEKFQGNWQKSRVIKWLFNTYNPELPGWAWTGLFLLIVILSVLVFWLIVRKPKGKVIKDENAIKYMLKQSWDEMKNEDFDTEEEMYIFSGIDEAPFKDSLIFNSPTRLKSGSAKEYFPEIVCGDKNYEIVSIEKDTIIIRRKDEKISTLVDVLNNKK